MIANFNYSATDLISEFEDKVINANIDFNELSLEKRYSILFNFKDNNGEYRFTNQNDLIIAINNSNFLDKQKLVNYVNSASNIVFTNLDNCYSLNQNLDNIKNFASTDLTNQSLVVLKSYIETLKASAYFWYPIDKGGSGIGYSHMESIETYATNNKPQPTNPKLAAALVSDASSMSIGMVAIAIGGIFSPLGPAVLISCAAQAAVSSGLAAVLHSKF